MYFEEIKPGLTVETDPVRIEKADMLAFAEKYDPLPFHTDEAYARTTRFGKLLAPGVMAFMSVWALYTKKDFAGAQLIAGKSTHIEWFVPVCAGDELYGRAEVTGVTPRNPYNGLVEITIDVYNQRGERVLRDVTEEVVERQPLRPEE